MRVRVAGLSKAVRIVLEDVLVRADDQYHITQRPYKDEEKQIISPRLALNLARSSHLRGRQRGVEHTISFHETGARRAPAISWAFWVILDERIRLTVWLMLLFLAWPDGPTTGSRGAHLTLLSRRAVQRPACAASPLLPELKPFCCQRGAEAGWLLLGNAVCPASKSGNFSVSPGPNDPPPWGESP